MAKKGATTENMYAENRRARFDYEILETVEAGVELLGHEVKSVRAGSMSLAGSHAVVRNGQLWLLNAAIAPYQPGNIEKDYDPSRSRRLLVHGEELKTLLGKLEQKHFTLVPLKVYDKHNRIKILIGVAKSKTSADKRETIKKRSAEREIGRHI